MWPLRAYIMPTGKYYWCLLPLYTLLCAVSCSLLLLPIFDVLSLIASSQNYCNLAITLRGRAETCRQTKNPKLVSR